MLIKELIKGGEKGPFHIGADAVSFLGDSINLLIEAREKRLKLTNFDQSAPNRLICDISDFNSHKWKVYFLPIFQVLKI